MAAECPICCEYYNRTTHSSITCEYGDCRFTACKKCVRHYLLETTSDPSCMNCKKAWSQNFMVLKLNRSFVTNDYRKHRSNLLLEVEISKLPEAMLIVERYKRSDEIIKEAQAMKPEIDKITEEYNRCQREYEKKLNAINEKRMVLRNKQDKIYQHAYEVRTNSKYEEKEKKKFIMACPHEECRGFLSTQYKCGLCDRHVCPKCNEIIGFSKNVEHTCKEENVKSAELIKKETKPCPKCGTRIYKIDGCDQMWCTECHCAFSWRTGKIDKGVVHNPHYYQYHNNNNNPVPRNPGDVVCGGLCPYWFLHGRILKKLPQKTEIVNNRSKTVYIDETLAKEIIEIHAFIQHITNVTLVETRTKIRELQDFETERVQYLMEEITKDFLETKIYKSDCERRKYMELLHIYELIHTVGIETYGDFANSKLVGDEFHKYLITRVNELRNLRDYCNEQFKTISITYNRTTPMISDFWSINGQKGSLKKARAESEKK